MYNFESKLLVMVESGGHGVGRKHGRIGSLDAKKGKCKVGWWRS